LELAQLGDAGWLVVGHDVHAQAAERGAGSPLQLAQGGQILRRRLSHHVLSLHPLGRDGTEGPQADR